MKTKNITIGDQAPDFTSYDQNNHEWHLADHSGSWMLLYFYPKDFTAGCTIEAQEFQKHFDELKKKVTIVGISADSTDSHKQFCEKYGLEFTLLADPKKEIITTYGTDGILFTRRASFLVDDKGIVRKIYNNVDPKVHAQDILADLATLGV